MSRGSAVAAASVRVCFVCLGNICRSPTAEGVMKHLVQRAGLGERVAVESAGTADYHTGELPDRRARAAAQARGVALESRARQFVAGDFARLDYVLAMDEENERNLQRLAPDAEARAKVRLLRSFDAASPPGAPVPDPYYGGDDGFEQVLDLCEAACAGLLAELRREHRL
ncbi:MAG TPA: low molecular weight protein-tyrosine-phosphatase [Polyangiaceae bacterium]|nr:low molecular weight protein-tyrosine-phosphatase [Polyangiaceae bacterium]